MNESTGLIIWMTGRSGSGKTTLSQAMQKKIDPYVACTILDGDEVRKGLCSDLDYGDAGRVENTRRVGEAAMLMAQAGLVVIVALISPMREDRDKVKARCRENGIKFLEVYIFATPEECARRDPKGLYKKIPDLVDADHQPPLRPNIVINTELLKLDGSLEKLGNFLLTFIFYNILL